MHACASDAPVHASSCACCRTRRASLRQPALTSSSFVSCVWCPSSPAALQTPPRPLPAPPKEPRQRRPPAAGQPPAKRAKEGGNIGGGGSGGYGAGGGSGGGGSSSTSPRSRGAPLQWPSDGPHRVTVHQQALPLEPLHPRNGGRGGRGSKSVSLSPSPTPSPRHSWGMAGAFQQYGGGGGAISGVVAAAAAAAAGGGGGGGPRARGPGLVSQPSMAVSEELLIAPVLSGYGQLQELAWPFPLGLPGGGGSGGMTPPGVTPSSRLTPPAGLTPCSSPTAAGMRGGMHSIHGTHSIPELPAHLRRDGSHGEAALLGAAGGISPPGAPPPPPLLGPGFGAGTMLGPSMAFNPLLLPGLGFHLQEPSMPHTLAGAVQFTAAQAAAAAAGGPVVSLPEDPRPAQPGGAGPLPQPDLLPIPPLSDVAGGTGSIPITWPLA